VNTRASRVRTLCLEVVAMMALTASAFATPSWAQYEIHRFRVAGGGTTSIGGAYAVTGTAGQSDAGAMTGGAYALRGGFWQGGSGVVGVDDDPEPKLPIAFALHRAVPNPVISSTVLHFDLPHTSSARMVVYDAAGRAVRTLVQGTMPPGRHRQVWNGTNEAGRSLGAGVYFVRFEAGSFQARQRIVLLD
jgi:hypothetical protein